MQALRSRRDSARVEEALARLKRDAADENTNLMPAIIDASKAYVTMGEMCDALREVWGVWRETPVFLTSHLDDEAVVRAGNAVGLGELHRPVREEDRSSPRRPELLLPTGDRAADRRPRRRRASPHRRTGRRRAPGRRSRGTVPSRRSTRASCRRGRRGSRTPRGCNEAAGALRPPCPRPRTARPARTRAARTRPRTCSGSPRTTRTWRARRFPWAAPIRRRARAGRPARTCSARPMGRGHPSGRGGSA